MNLGQCSQEPRGPQPSFEDARLDPTRADPFPSSPLAASSCPADDTGGREQTGGDGKGSLTIPGVSGADLLKLAT